jgi:hypothetical protein
VLGEKAALAQLNFLNLGEAELDQHVYRIMPQDFVIALFAERENVLSQVHNWKDKFENFQLKLGGILNGERFEFGFKDDFVGQCWTTDSLSEAMWASTPTIPRCGIFAFDRRRANSSPVCKRRTRRCPQDTCFIGKGRV